MTAPVPIAFTDCTPKQLHERANKCNDTRQARRLRAVANVLDGKSRNEAAQATGTTVQSIRDWVVRYNAHGPDGLIDAPRTGRPRRLTQEQRAEVAS